MTAMRETIGQAGDEIPGADAAKLSAAWTRVCQRLRAEFGEDVYSSWFARLELDRVERGVACCSVPTKFLKSWIQSHYNDRIIPVISAEIPEVRGVAIEVRTVTRRPIARVEPHLVSATPKLDHENLPKVSVIRGDHSAAPSTSHADEGALIGAPLDRRFTFDAFLVGDSNRLAHAAALRVANATLHEPAQYNPLYIHASVGLGRRISFRRLHSPPSRPGSGRST